MILSGYRLIPCAPCTMPGGGCFRHAKESEWIAGCAFLSGAKREVRNRRSPRGTLNDGALASTRTPRENGDRRRGRPEVGRGGWEEAAFSLGPDSGEPAVPDPERLRLPGAEPDGGAHRRSLFRQGRRLIGARTKPGRRSSVPISPRMYKRRPVPRVPEWGKRKVPPANHPGQDSCRRFRGEPQAFRPPGIWRCPLLHP